MSSSAAVIPNPLYEVRAYRFRKSFNKWKHHSTRLSSSDSISSPAPIHSRALNDSGEDEDSSGSNSTDETLVSTTTASTKGSSRFQNRKRYPSQIRVITWNIDFMSPHAKERLIAALRHLEEDVLQCKDGIVTRDQACVILFQEVHKHVLPVFWEDEWVKENFYMAPFNHGRWPRGAEYGLVTLVERSLDLRYSGLLEFKWTCQGRGGLLVDVALSAPGSDDGNDDSTDDGGREVVVRIVNTHLESLQDPHNLRGRQLGLLTRLLRVGDVEAGIIAGDMNAIEPQDRGLPAQLGLKDAWKKGDDDEGGITWGKQGGGNYPAARLDKVLYLSKSGFKVDEPQRIGIGLKAVCDDDEEVWASDHYGLMTTLSLG